MGKETALYTSPPVRQFRRSDSGEMLDQLDRIERATTIYPVGDLDELQLEADGTTRRGGFRYTSHAFQQVCQLVCPGLSKMLPDLSGTIRRAGVAESLYSPQDARMVFNQILSLRFDLLSSYRVIFDEEHKLIEGLMGVKHRVLNNLSSFEQTRDAISSLAPEHVFYAGLLVGRRMMLWYRRQTPLFLLEVPQPWKFYDGYYFANGEATGSSVRGTFAIYTQPGMCLRPFKKVDRVTHIGRDFSRRLAKMFRSILGAPVPVDELRAGCQKMLEVSLGYEDMDSKQRKEHDKRVIRGLGALGVPQRIADAILDDAICTGRGKREDEIPEYDPGALFSRRRVFDVFAATLRAARSQPANRREKLEQAAYLLISGKLEI